MEFVIQKEILLNNLKTVEKVTVSKPIQPVLSNIFIEVYDDQTIKFAATDLEISVETKAIATVSKAGNITIPSRKLMDIVQKLPDEPVSFSVNIENNVVTLTCGSSKFEIIGIKGDEFPNLIDKTSIEKAEDSIEIELKPLVNSIKKTVFAAANYETNNVLGGVFFCVEGQKLEMAATDGNRLARSIDVISNEKGASTSAIIPSKTLAEFLRFTSNTSEEKITIVINKNQITFKLEDRYLLSRLLEGQYPKYQQLIPQKGDKKVVVNRESFISAIDRTSTMVNERTNIVKLTFNENKVLLKSDTPEAGASMDLIDAEYEDEEISIAFNYKYVLDALRIMDSEKIRMELSGPLSATLFMPESDEDYLCLIMPVQIR